MPPSAKRLNRWIHENDEMLGHCQGRSFDSRTEHMPTAPGQTLELLQALSVSLRVEILYIFHIEAWDDSSFRALLTLLRRGRIWAVNLGELPLADHEWWQLADALPFTAVAFVYVSEGPANRLKRDGVTLRNAFMDSVRVNRHAYGQRDGLGMMYVVKIWYSGGSAVTKRFKDPDREHGALVRGAETEDALRRRHIYEARRLAAGKERLARADGSLAQLLLPPRPQAQQSFAVLGAGCEPAHAVEELILPPQRGATDAELCAAEEEVLQELLTDGCPRHSERCCNGLVCMMCDSEFADEKARKAHEKAHMQPLPLQEARVWQALQTRTRVERAHELAC